MDREQLFLEQTTSRSKKTASVSAINAKIEFPIIEDGTAADDDDGTTIPIPNLATEAKQKKNSSIVDCITSILDCITSVMRTLGNATTRSPAEIPWRCVGCQLESFGINEHPAKSLHHNEHLQNVRNIITLAAALIAALTYTAGITTPCDVYQEIVLDELGRTTLYKVFIVCNNIAFFLSFGIITVLFGVIPLQHKSMTKLLFVTRNILGVAVSFMIAAYIATTWMIAHSAKGRPSMLESLALIGGRCLALLFVGLGIIVVELCLRKRDGGQTKKRKARAPIRTGMSHNIGSKKLSCDIGSKVHNYADSFLPRDPDGHPVR